MASNDKASEPADEALEGSWSPRRSKATAKKAKSASAVTPDPEALAGDIERTREELAETLDAIADRVSPKKAAARTKKKVGDAVKDGAHDAAEAVKDTAGDAAEAVKSSVAAVKERVTPERDAVPPAPAMSVDADAAAPISGVHVPVEPAPTPGALADVAVSPVEPVGAETPEAPSYPASLPPAAPSRLPVFAGAVVALVVLLLLRRRRRR